MYNINMYEYKEKPYAKARRYAIYPLNDKGREKYISNDSHNVNYISKINPKVFREIVRDVYEKIDKKAEGESLPHDSTSQQNQLKQQEGIDKAPGEIQAEKGLEHASSCNDNHTSTPQAQPIASSSMPKYKLYKRLFMNRSFKQKFGYERKVPIETNQDKYSTLIRNFQRKKLTTNASDLNKTNFSLLPRKYDGFPFYCVPRTDKLKRREHSLIMKDIQMKMTRSLSFNDQYNENEPSFYMMKNKRIKDNLTNQTNKDYLHFLKLPEIDKVANTVKVFRMTENGNSKNMGEKYNPYSNVTANFNRTKRNYTGSLFQH